MSRVYISSSRMDLHHERTEIAEWLQSNGLEAVDSYGPSGDPLVQTCLDDVASCDVVVLILGYRRGHVPPEDNPEGLSITRMEFRHALARKIPVVPLQTTRPDANTSNLLNPDDRAHAEAFHAEVGRTHVPGQFANLDELRSQLARGMERELEKLGQRLPANGISAQLLRASRDLLAWPTTLPNGEWLEPPELAQWRSRFEHAVSSTTLLLGEPGCGKSALLARLGKTLTEQGVAVLGIKADLLPPETKETQLLSQALNLPHSVEALVRRLAADQPVVVLIDQLDAVADLVVLRPERLRLLLDLIQGLSGISNVHVLATCRSFERTHDRTLRNLELEEITLQLPTWEKVETVLLAHGVSTGAWSDEMRETVRSPHALNAFLQLLPGTAEPDLAHGIHGLLEQQWSRQVIGADPTGRRKQVMMTLTNGMAEEEALWLPAARLEDNFEALQALQREGLLLIPDGEGRVGFRHQTWFEFLRGRNFLEQRGLLADTVLAGQDHLRIRAQLWHALLYLRRVDHGRYAHELNMLWNNGALRLHLRMLLVAFMGMQKTPLPCEESIAWASFDDRWFRPRFLGAVIGSTGWFQALLPCHLPLLMRQSAPDNHLTRAVLEAAAAALPNEVLTLLDKYWLPRPDMDALSWTLLVRSNALPVTQAWLTRLERIVRRSQISDWNINEAISMASTELPTRAPHLLCIWLEQRWKEISPQENVAKLLRALLESSHLNDLPAVAQAAPAAYLRTLWPLLEEFFAVDVRKDEIHIVCYHRSIGHLDPWDDGRYRAPSEFLQSLCVAVEAWGETEPAELIAFVRENEQTELMLLQRLFAMGLAKAAQSKPAMTLEFLLADPRRLSLGNLSDVHRESRMLISQLVPHLDADELARLEQAISSVDIYRNIPEDDASTRWARRRWNREHRKRLFMAFPSEQRSPEVKVLLDSSRRSQAQKDADDDDDQGLHVIGSPVGYATEELVDEGIEVPSVLISHLKAWLQPAKGDSEAFQRTESQDRLESQLWGYGASIPLPDGNFPLLIGLSRYFLTRRPVAYEEWLNVLEDHLKRSESAQVWEAVGRQYFHRLQDVDHDRAQAFLDTLFSSYPSILGDTGCIRMVCGLLRWIAPHYAEKWLGLMTSQGSRGQVGSAELLLVRHVWWPEERWATEAIENILTIADPEHLTLRVGLAHTVAQLWKEAPLRELGKTYLLRLIPSTEKPVLRALASAFRHDTPWLPDLHTRDVLDALATYPSIFLTGNGEFALEVLEHLVRYEPDRVYKVVAALIDTVADELANTATSWAYRSDALVSIALTLQDKGGEHSARGATLFERLLEFNVPAATNAVLKLDRRTPNTQSWQPARRRRFRR